jgi:nicotinamide-nucleotide adenylyltransferase
VRERFHDLDRLIEHSQTVRRLGVVGEGELRQLVGAPPTPGTRLGLLAGSFNPPTIAHQVLALAGLSAGGLDRVWYTLSIHTVGKEVVTGAALDDRLLLLELLAQDDPRLGVLLINHGLYVDQAKVIRAAYPTLTDLVCLVGYDKIVQIFDPRYYDDRDAELDQLFTLVTFLVAPRGNDDAADLAELLGRSENRRFTGAIRPLDLPPDLREVASSHVRIGLTEGRQSDQTVPPEVMAFIEETGLYVDDARYARRRAAIDEAVAAAADPGADLTPYRERLRAL